MLIPIIVCGVILLVLIIMYFVYNNREVALRKEADAQRGKIESVYDTMWKVLKQEAGVTEQYRKTFEEIYPKLIAGRYAADGKELIKMIKESNPAFDTKLYDKLMQAFGGNLKYLIIGGAALNHEVEKCLKQIKFPYCVGYGMTECAPLIAYTPWEHFKIRSCGKVVDRMQVKVDSENPQKVVGEIMVKGESVMNGYYKNQAATDAIFTEDGWMKTGDLGVIDADGNIFIRGRNKNMILSGNGQNIYPEEIENLINKLPFVSETMVYGKNKGKKSKRNNPYWWT